MKNILEDYNKWFNTMHLLCNFCGFINFCFFSSQPANKKQICFSCTGKQFNVPCLGHKFCALKVEFTFFLKKNQYFYFTLAHCKLCSRSQFNLPVLFQMQTSLNIYKQIKIIHVSEIFSQEFGFQHQKYRKRVPGGLLCWKENT